MVCRRCIWAVEALCERLGLRYSRVELGRLELTEALETSQLEALAEGFQVLGFELLSDKRSQLLSEIKQLVLELVQQPEGSPQVKLSDYLSGQLGQDYAGLSSFFSQQEGMTLERYFILQRVERVKELIAYEELTLTEIAYRMGYSSVAYLSSQFKRVTGMSPSQFRAQRDALRLPLDSL